MKHAPLLRHSTLKPFSRDHHTGLVHANRLVRSADGDPATRCVAARDFLDAWHAEIAQHFEDEEWLLLDLMSQCDVNRLNSEHAQLRALVTEATRQLAASTPDANWVRHLGQLLHDHIRWEERELFPKLQEFGADQLDVLEPESRRIEAGRPRAELKPRRDACSVSDALE